MGVEDMDPCDSHPLLWTPSEAIAAARLWSSDPLSALALTNETHQSSSSALDSLAAGSHSAIDFSSRMEPPQEVTFKPKLFSHHPVREYEPPEVLGASQHSGGAEGGETARPLKATVERRVEQERMGRLFGSDHIAMAGLGVDGTTKEEGLACAVALLLWKRFDEDGFILVRGLMSKTLVNTARAAVADQLKPHDAANQALDLEDGARATDASPGVSCIADARGFTVQALSGDVITGRDKYARDSVRECDKNSWSKTAHGKAMNAIFQSEAVGNLLQQLSLGAALDRSQQAACKRNEILSANDESKVQGLSREEALRQSLEPVVFHPVFTWLRIKVLSTFPHLRYHIPGIWLII